MRRLTIVVSKVAMGFLVTVLAGALGGWTYDLGDAKGDGLRVSLAVDGRLTSLWAAGIQVPLRGEGGFAFADFALDKPRPNLVPNSGFEAGTNGWALARGQALDDQVVRSGKQSVRIQTGPGAESSDLAVVVPVKPEARYWVGAWVRRQDDSRSGLYCSDLDDKGKVIGGKQTSAKMPSIKGVWQPAFWEVRTQPGTARLRLRGNIYQSEGVLWLDDFVVREVDEGDFEPFIGHIDESPTGLRYDARQDSAHLHLVAEFLPVKYGVKVTGSVADTSGQDRAVGIRFGLPIDASGWTWWLDSDEREPVHANSQHRFTYRCESGIGECSVYPWCAVSSPHAGISLGLPLDQGPQVFILQHDQRLPCTSLTFYCGLTKDAGRHPSAAQFSFVLYSHDPAWGMRSAMQRYYELNPQSFARRATRPLYLNYGDLERLDPTTGELVVGKRLHIPQGLDFGEAADSVHHLGCSYDFWQLPTANTNRLTDSEVVAGLQASGLNKRLRYAGAPSFQDLLKMMVYDGRGQFRYIGDTRYRQPHEGYNRSDAPGWGLNFRVNDDPDLCSTRADALRKDLASYVSAKPSRTPWLAAVTADAVEGYQGNQLGLDYRRDHFRTTLAPLTFGYQNLQPALANTIWDFHRKFLYPLSQQETFLICGNANGYGQCFTAPFVDIGMVEYCWDLQHPDRVERYVRALGYQKMWRYWHVLDAKGNYADDRLDLLDTQFKRCLALDIFPPDYCLARGSAANMETVRPWFQKYIPALEELWEAGWEPVPYARAGGCTVERFGQYADGSLHYTLRNRTSQKLGIRLVLDTGALGVPPNSTLLYLDLTQPNSGFATFDRMTSLLDLEAQDVKALWIGSRVQLIQRSFRVAQEVATKMRLYTSLPRRAELDLREVELQCSTALGAPSENEAMRVHFQSVVERLVALLSRKEQAELGCLTERLLTEQRRIAALPE